MADVLSKHTSHSTHATKSYPIHSYKKWTNEEWGVGEKVWKHAKQAKKNALKQDFTSRPHIVHPSTTVQLCSINGLSTRPQSQTNTTQTTCISPEKRINFVHIAQKSMSVNLMVIWKVNLDSTAHWQQFEMLQKLYWSEPIVVRYAN